MCAPAGYGKTTVLAAAARRLGWKVAWYRLDHFDHDPCTFVTSLAESVRRVVPAFAEALLARLTAGDGHDLPLHELLVAFVTALVEETEGDLFLVLDDFHEAGASREVSPAFGYVLANLPANVHVVVLTRHAPSFAVAKLRLAGELCEIDHGRLRFDRTQVQHLLRRQGSPPLDAGQIDLLLEAVEGWPAGVVLAIDHLAATGDAVGDLLGDARLVHDVHAYFTEQVLAEEDEATVRFLKATCCLDDMTVDLAERVTGNDEASRHLGHLIKSGVFTFVSAGQGTYRYHRLFREFLRERCLQEDGIAFFRDLHVRTARALRSAGHFAAATELYLAADFPAAALSTIAEGGAGMIESCPGATLRSWSDRLASGLSRRDPWVHLLEGQLLAREGRHDQALTRYSQAEDLFGEADDRRGTCQALSLMADALSQKGGESAAAACCRRALACASDDEQRLHALAGLASPALRACDWETAHRVWREVAHAAAPSPRDEARIACQKVAELTLKGDFRQAAVQGRHLLAGLTAPGLSGIELPFRDELATAEIHGADYDLASEHLGRCLEESDRLGFTYVRRIAEGTLGLLWLMRGHVEHGIDLLSAASHDPALAGDVVRRAGYLRHAGTAWRREGDLERARRLFDEALGLPRIESYPAAFIGCLADREFTRSPTIDVGDERRRRAIQAAACRYGLRFIELELAFLRACLESEHGEGDIAATGLPGVVSRQLELGHMSFVGHELTLRPSLTTALLGRCGRATAAGLIDALCRHWKPLPLAMKALTVSEPVAVQALRTAAAGFCEEDLHRLVRRARRSRYPAARRLAAELMTAGGGETSPPAVSLPELTPRETEVLGLIASGRSNAELAAELCLSPATVKTHINHIFSKLGVRDRVQAIIAYRSRMKL